ncbi:MAG TPA: hypothetical protein PKB02_07545 [Anaerohalosphaeraceae bacterium]|nr:hypothetical protein [Anaerohalosphaeraceae bacterium]
MSVFALMLLIFTTVSVQAVTWVGNGSDWLWSTGANWNTGTAPLSNQDVFINTGTARQPLISVGVVAVGAVIRIGGSATTEILTVTGGSLTASALILGEGVGSSVTLNMNGGTLTVGALWAGNNGNGTVNMSGGVMTLTAESLYVTRFGTSKGFGYVHLDGGTITAPGIYMAGGNLDITAGNLVLSGDKRTTINTYIANGWITAYGGTGSVEVVYNGSHTTVSSIAVYKASQPNPANGAIALSLTPTLSWMAGYGAVRHDVWFGMSPDALTKVATAQPGTSYAPALLIEGQTYYWRIDEINENGTVTTGDTWSFTSVTALLSPVFECTSFRLIFDTSGKISSLYYKPLNRELISGISGNEGFIVYNLAGSNVYLDRVYRTNQGKMIAYSSNGLYTVLFDVTEDDKHIAFRIESLTGFDTTENTKLKFQIHPNLSGKLASAVPAKYGSGVGVGVMSLDWMTWTISDFQVEWRYLWHRTDNPADPIGGFAIFACDESNTLQTIGEVEQREDLPHPLYGGVWAKQKNDVARMAEMYVAFSGPTERNRAVDYCQRGGIGVFYLPQGVWESGSPYNVNLSNWPKGMDSLRDFSESLNSKGMLLGIHTGSCSLWNSDEVYVKPSPDPRLASWGSGRLAQAVSKADTNIYFVPDEGTVMPVNTSERHGLRPPVYQDIWGWEKIQIGNEIIKVGSYDDSTVPWHLSGCARAQEGTSAASHGAGKTVKGLLTVYNHLAVDPDSTLLDEIADKMSNLVNYCKVGRLSFDALETIESGGRWGMNKFMAKAYEGFDHFVANDSSSGLTQYEWHVAAFANNGEPMHFYPKAYFEGYLIGSDNSNFVPEGLGALTFRKDSRINAWHASSPDEWQWWLAKAAAYDATYWFWSSVSELDGNGQTGEILDLCKKWERAKLMNVFTSSQKTQMKDYDTTFQLISSDIDSFSWQISPSKITPVFVKSDKTASFTNSYEAQPLQFEARVLPYYDYSSASNTGLLPGEVSDLTIDSGLSVTKNVNNEWTLTSSSNSPRQANRSIAPTDLSLKRGLGLWIKGDNLGGYFYVEYSSGMQRHYIVPNNFIDWRYVEIPDYEPADYSYRDTLYYKFQDPYGTIRQGFRYNAINRISFGITAVPSGNTATVIIKEPKALSEITEPLHNLQLSAGSSVLMVNGSVDSGNYIVYKGGNSVDILDSNRFYIRSMPVIISNWIIPTGSSVISVSSTSTNKPWLKMLFKTLGTPFNIPNPMDADINDDGDIDLTDFMIIVDNWMSDGIFSSGDLNWDNKVNLTDFSVMASEW